MAEEKTLNDRLDIRINDEDKQDFIDRCAELKRQPQSLLREMVVALNERRLRIRVSNDQLKSQQELYDVN